MEIKLKHLLESMYALETIQHAGRPPVPQSSEVIKEIERFCEVHGVVLMLQETYDHIMQVQNGAVQASCKTHEENIGLRNALLCMKDERDNAMSAYDACHEKFQSLHTKYCNFLQKYCPRNGEVINANE